DPACGHLAAGALARTAPPRLGAPRTARGRGGRDRGGRGLLALRPPGHAGPALAALGGIRGTPARPARRLCPGWAALRGACRVVVAALALRGNRQDPGPAPGARPPGPPVRHRQPLAGHRRRAPGGAGIAPAVPSRRRGPRPARAAGGRAVPDPAALVRPATPGSRTPADQQRAGPQ